MNIRILVATLACFVFCLPTYSFSQNISTFAGNGAAGFSGDGGPATAAKLNHPYCSTSDAAGNIFVTDYDNNRIRKIDTNGIISTIAGTGVAGYNGDNGQATAARIQHPIGITMDLSGNIVFSDYGNNVIRKINQSTGIITTIVGVGGSPGFSGDGGQASAARLAFAWGVAYDRAGNLFISDNQNCRIRKVNPSGVISTICGTGGCGYSGDGGGADTATVQYPFGITVDARHNIYISDNGDNIIRKIDAGNIINTVGGVPGIGSYGFTGDGGPATAAKIYYPNDINVDDTGKVYFADMTNNRIRRIDTFGIMNTICGTGDTAFTGDNGPATAASLYAPTGVFVDSRRRRTYICDRMHNRIRLIDSTYIPQFVSNNPHTIYVCNTDTMDVSGPLSVLEKDPNQTLTWYLATLPLHGTAIVRDSEVSTGGVSTPMGLKYRPNPTYSGIDSYKVVVCDGKYFDTITIRMDVSGQPNAGTIRGRDSICIGDTMTLSSTQFGGLWSLSDTFTAKITSAGVVTGYLVGGPDTVTYIYTNACGFDVSHFQFKVVNNRTYCNTAVPVFDNNIAGLTVAPNPNAGTFNIRFNTAISGTARITITDMLGRSVEAFTIANNVQTEHTFRHSAGVYLLTAQSGNEHSATRLVILE